MSQAKDVDAIHLGDVDIERVDEVAQFVGSDKRKVERVDPSNIDKKVAQMKQRPYELVVNVALPVFDRPILEAFVKAKINMPLF